MSSGRSACSARSRRPCPPRSPAAGRPATGRASPRPRGRRLPHRRQGAHGFHTVRDRGVEILTFDSIGWGGATIGASGALIYNHTREDRAVAVIGFKREYSTVYGEWVLPMPPPTA